MGRGPNSAQFIEANLNLKFTMASRERALMGRSRGQDQLINTLWQVNYN